MPKNAMLSQSRLSISSLPGLAHLTVESNGAYFPTVRNHRLVHAEIQSRRLSLDLTVQRWLVSWLQDLG